MLPEPEPDSSHRPVSAEPSGSLLAVLVARQAAGAVAERHGVHTVPALLGSSEECDLILDWPSIGERHGELSLESGVWNVAALDPELPVVVDGERVTDRLPLAPGSSLRMGDLELAFLPCDVLESPPLPQPATVAETTGKRRSAPPQFLDDVDVPVDGKLWQWILAAIAVLVALLLLVLGVGR